MKPITDQKPPKRVFQIVDTVPADEKRPYSLLGPSGDVLDLDASTGRLATLAFERFDATEVDHVYLQHRGSGAPTEPIVLSPDDDALTESERDHRRRCHLHPEYEGPPVAGWEKGNYVGDKPAPVGTCPYGCGADATPSGMFSACAAGCDT